MKIHEQKLLEYLKTKKNADKDEIVFFAKNPAFKKHFCESFREFVDSPYYLGIGDDIYEKVKQEGEKIWDGIKKGKITEGIALWGIGSGKSILAEILSCLFVHYLLCIKEPHKFFGLTNDKPLAVVNMGITATQAANVIFAGIRKFIENSPFFQEHLPRITQTQIEFANKNIILYSGNSQETMPIGMNLIFLSLDEAAWYIDNENRSIAEEIYLTNKNRIVSRFGDRGFVFIISAVRYIDDFISRKYEKSLEKDYIYKSKFKTWDVKDRNKMSKETFNFVVSADKHGKSLEIWKDIPMDFKKVSESNPEKFMRDFGARASLVFEAFDRDVNILVRERSDRESPIDSSGQFKDWFVAGENEPPRFIHIDLGLTKDACGFAMGKFDGWDYSNDEQKPKVFIDFVLQIKAKPQEEIIFEEIRKLIYTLQDRGFKIAGVSYDGFQSIDSIQILRNRGIEAEILSVDRTLEPYETLKELIHARRFNCYHYEPFVKEYTRLELVKGKKVDHPLHGSKDVSDAVAGACFRIVKSIEEVGGQFAEHDEAEEAEAFKDSVGDLLNRNF